MSKVISLPEKATVADHDLLFRITPGPASFVRRRRQEELPVEAFLAQPRARRQGPDGAKVSLAARREDRREQQQMGRAAHRNDQEASGPQAGRN